MISDPENDRLLAYAWLFIFMAGGGTVSINAAWASTHPRDRQGVLL